jgi:hypothetical protein
MKLSVSVPDELWMKACRRIDDDSPSAVVQSALSRLAATAATDYQVRPVSDEISAALEAARAYVVADAREMFQAGYAKGLELAAQLRYQQLEWIVRTGGVEAARDAASRGPDPGSYAAPIRSGLLAKYFGSYADPLDGVEWTPSRPTTEGIDAALHDVWQRVTETVDLAGGDAEDAEQQ